MSKCTTLEEEWNLNLADDESLFNFFVADANSTRSRNVATRYRREYVQKMLRLLHGNSSLLNVRRMIVFKKNYENNKNALYGTRFLSPPPHPHASNPFCCSSSFVISFSQTRTMNDDDSLNLPVDGRAPLFFDERICLGEVLGPVKPSMSGET